MEERRGVKAREGQLSVRMKDLLANKVVEEVNSRKNLEVTKILEKLSYL